MKKILVPCNFSSCCERAIRFAAELAEKSGGEVIVLTVINGLDKLGLPDQQLMNIAAKSAKLKFGEITKSITSNAVFRHLIKKGKLLPAVLRCISRQEIDLVVMGTKGSRGWNQFFMGSNTEKVVRTSPVPVFAVKDDISVNSIKNIVFPSNLKTNQSKLIQNIKALQKIFNAKLHILRIYTYVKEDLADIKQNMEEYAKHYGLENYTLNVWNDINRNEGILHFAKEINADMIAMPTHGKRDLKHLYANSISADVVNHSPILTWTCSIKSKDVNKKIASLKEEKKITNVFLS